MVRPTKHPKTGIYRVRKAVPAALRPLVGKREWVESLGTKDKQEAKARAPAAIARMEAQHAAALAKSRGEAVRLTPREVVAVVGEWYRAAVADMEAAPGRPDARDMELDLLRSDLEDPEHPGEVLPGAEGRAAAQALLEARGIAADADTIRLAADLLARAKLDLARLAVRRAEGDWSPDEAAGCYPSSAAGAGSAERQRDGSGGDALPAEVLLKAWAAEQKPAASTLKKYTAVFRNLARVLGFDDVRRISEEDVVAFKAARLAQGRDPGTVADDVLAAGAVCRWAAKNRMLPGNPFAGLAPKASRRGPGKRAPYSDTEAAGILQAARAEDGWQRWLPWLLAFTGARISEVAELRRGDVRRDGAVWVLDVRPTADRAGKNDLFQRLLPLHPAVLAEGFLDYVASLPADPDGPLFPDLPRAKDGTRATTATTKLGRWVRNKVGIKDKGKAPSHSWRHRMEDQLRMIRALPEVVDAITGRHNPRNAGAGYGKGFRGMPDEVLKDLRRVPSPLACVEAPGAFPTARVEHSAA